MAKKERRNHMNLGAGKNFFDSVLKSFSDVVIVVGRNGQIEMCSPSLQKVFGYSAEEIGNINDLSDKGLFENKEDINALIWANTGTLPQEKVFQFTSKGGTRGWVRLLWDLFSADPNYIVLNIRDISLRKKAEIELVEARAEFEQIFHVAGDGIRVVLRDFVISRASRSFAQMCGFPDNTAGRKCYEVFPGTACNTSNCPVICIIQGAESVDFEVTKTRKDGSTLYCNVVATPFTDAHGKITGIVETFKDLSKLKDMQSQLLQSEKMASIGQIAAGVAHEINNPIGFINSNLVSLNEYRRDLMEVISHFLELEKLAGRIVEKDPAISASLETISNIKEKMDLEFILNDLENLINESREGTERVKKIIQDLKEFSHESEAELIRADINKGLSSTLNIAWNEIKYKAAVTKNFGEIPEVYCYPQQLNQVFMNILVNAAHAIKDRGEINITTLCLQGETPEIEVRISDTGTGITPEYLSRIFDPFFTTKPVGKGTGLGLSIAYNIIKKHNGQIKVDSEVGKGTTFTIRLPVGDPREQQNSEADQKTEQSGPVRQAADSRTIPPGELLGTV